MDKFTFGRINYKFGALSEKNTVYWNNGESVDLKVVVVKFMTIYSDTSANEDNSFRNHIR